MRFVTVTVVAFFTGYRRKTEKNCLKQRKCIVPSSNLEEGVRLNLPTLVQTERQPELISFRLLYGQ